MDVLDYKRLDGTTCRTSYIQHLGVDDEHLIGCDRPLSLFVIETVQTNMSNESKTPSFEDAEKSVSVPGSDADVTSRPVTSSASDVPNGGAKAWLQVLGSFFLFFNTWGILLFSPHTLAPALLLTSRSRHIECIRHL